MRSVPPETITVAAAKQSVDELASIIEAKSRICQADLGELRRQHHALARRRGGSRGSDASKYALRNTLVMVGAADLSGDALLGLLAHPVEMLAWVGEAVRAGAGPMFGDLARAIFADEEKLAWCEQWGRILQWRYRAALYQKAVQSFIDSGRTGPLEPWRQEPITNDQAALIVTLINILNEPAPVLSARGDAFDWLREKGGNPRYWQEPSPLPCKEFSSD